VKGYHVLEYTILTLLLIAAFSAFKQKPLLAGLIAIAYAATDEWHQTFVPHRGGHITDVLIDSLGVVIALAVYALVPRRSSTSSKVSHQSELV
jgi:VanZ family protein